MDYEWYIETDGNGVTLNYPARSTNLIQAFGHIPDHWQPVLRAGDLNLGPYQFISHPENTFTYSNGVWQEAYQIGELSDADKLAKQNAVKAWWNSVPRPNLSAWTFNETTCRYEAPIPMPPETPDVLYFWQGTTNTWQIRPPYPMDGKKYKLDFPTGTWVEVTT